jgi:hypothetical protein
MSHVPVRALTLPRRDIGLIEGKASQGRHLAIHARHIAARLTELAAEVHLVHNRNQK